MCEDVIHSFILDISKAHLQVRSRHITDIVLEFHAEAPQSTVSEGLAQGPWSGFRTHQTRPVMMNGRVR